MEDDRGWRLIANLVEKMSPIRFGYITLRIKNGRVCNPIRIEETIIVEGIESDAPTDRLYEMRPGKQ